MSIVADFIPRKDSSPPIPSITLEPLSPTSLLSPAMRWQPGDGLTDDQIEGFFFLCFVIRLPLKNMKCYFFCLFIFCFIIFFLKFSLLEITPVSSSSSSASLLFSSFLLHSFLFHFRFYFISFFISFPFLFHFLFIFSFLSPPSLPLPPLPLFFKT
jgi:hypothetical protein